MQPPRALSGGAPDRFVLVLSVVLLAFNDLPAILPLGELSSDAFIYAVPVLALCLLRSPGGIAVPARLLYFAGAFGACVLLGIAVNYPEIAGAYFKGRSGFGRVATQSLTFSLGLLISLLFYNFAKRGMVASIVKGARVAVLVMTVVGIFEVASWYSVPGLTQINEALLIVLHAQSGVEYVHRLRTTAFEVSWAGVMLTFFFPFATISIDGRRSATLLYSGLVTVLVVLSQSRTSLLVFGFQALVLFCYNVRGRLDWMMHAIALGSLVALLLATSTTFYDRAAETLTNVVEYGRFEPPDDGLDTNVSNITRAAAVRAAESMFRERPLLGFGFGQFGFHYTTYLEAGDFRSYEVRDYASDSGERWPPVYSVHARLLAETGLMGYAVWLGFILMLLARSSRIIMQAGVDTRLAAVHVALAMTLAGMLLLGASIDSFRFFGGWIAIGVALGIPNGSRPRPT